MPPDDPRPPPAWPPPPDPARRTSSGYAAPQPAIVREREPRAFASLVMGIVGLLLFFVLLPAFLLGSSAVVAGISGLVRLRRHPDRYGRSMALTGIGTGLLSIALAVVLLNATSGYESDDPLTIPYAELNLGDCFQDPEPVERRPEFRRESGIEVRPCGSEHDRQAIGAVEHPAPARAAFPGTAVLDEFAAERCRGAFDRFVDLPEEQSALGASDLVPTEARWKSGSRHVVCAVAGRDGRPLTGSVTDNSLATGSGGR